MQRNDLLVWIDLEMTGLDPQKDVITEIATIITDSELTVVAEGPDLVLKIDDPVLQERTFSNTDFPLLEEFKNTIATSTITQEDAERQTLDFIEAYVTKGSSPLCGNSVHMDRYFLIAHMPKIIDHLHYRNIDVSTLKELARRWYPSTFEEATARKKGAHRAKDDILESIEELRFYRERILQ